MSFSFPSGGFWWNEGGFAPVALSWSLDFTQSAASYRGLTSSAAGSVLLFLSATTATIASGASNPHYEDRGDGLGGGVWTWPSTANEITGASVFSVSGASWTTFGGITFSTSGTRPDGGSAQVVTRPAAVTQTSSFKFAPGGGAVRTIAAVLRTNAGDPPTAAGCLFLNAPFKGVQLGTMTNWTRLTSYSRRDTVGGTADLLGLAPAGCDAATGSFSAATGSLDFGGYSSVLGDHDVPIITSGPASNTKTLDASIAKTVSPAGDFDVTLTFIPSLYSWYSEGSFYLFSATTADGELSIRYDSTQKGLILKVRGTDVLTAGSNSAWQYSTASNVVRVRAWYRVTTGQGGMRITVNGSTTYDATVSTTGGALAQPSAVYLGSDTSAANVATMRWSSVARESSLLPISPNVVLIGDSIVASSLVGSFCYLGVGSCIYTAAEAASIGTIGSLAHAGDTIANQKTKWQAAPSTWKTSALAVFIQVGVNNITNGNSAATITAALQDLVNTVAADAPQATIYLYQITPCKAALSGAQYTVWQTVNANIEGSGGTPITGATPCTECTAVAGAFTLNNGSDDLGSLYNAGDNLHTNNAGRAREGSAFRARLVTQGIL